MNKIVISFFYMSLFFPAIAMAVTKIKNPGFENGFQEWTKIDKDGKSVSLSKAAFQGKRSAKIKGPEGSFAQSVEIKENTNYSVEVNVLGAGILGVKIGKSVFFEKKRKSNKWKKVNVEFNSESERKVVIFAQFNNKVGVFDDFSIIEKKSIKTSKTSAVSIGKAGLSPDFSPGRNFSLTDWSLHIPADRNKDGKSDKVDEQKLAKGYQHKDFFYTGNDGGMVFRVGMKGARTSNKTKYIRSELREMLRQGNKKIATKGVNKNNWVFDSAPRSAQKRAGGVNGVLKATLAVNHVTTTGKAYQVGRVIIGQIHANDDEPIRLYYRKLPNHRKGSIYAAHEVLGGKDYFYDIVGSRDNNAPDPTDGIELDEVFSYSIDATGRQIKVIISRDNKKDVSLKIDISKSGYDKKDQYMYFKAGLYSQNNSGKDDDYAQATFYHLEKSHE